MQKTDFPFEIIIGEDESMDGTREICIEYASKYPDKIRLFLRSRKDVIYINGHSTGRHNFIENLKVSKGKYIALCEGDDYWTDPYKLQKQVDFLNNNQDFVICHHNMRIIYEDNSQKPRLSNSPQQREVTTIENLAQRNYIMTASCVYRNGLIKEFPDYFYKSPAGDYVLHMLNAQYGKIKYFPEVLGVYRAHSGGIWQPNGHIYHEKQTAQIIELMKNCFSPKVNNILKENQNRRYLYLMNQFRQDKEKYKYYLDRLLENDIYYLTDHYNQKMDWILNSYSFKLGNALIKPIRQIKNFLNSINLNQLF